MAEVFKKICCKCLKGKKDKVDDGEHIGSFRAGGGSDDDDDGEDWGNEDWDDVEAGKISNSDGNSGEQGPLLERKTGGSSRTAGQPYPNSSGSVRRNVKTRSRGIYSLKGKNANSGSKKVPIRHNTLVNKKAEDIFGSLGMDRKEMTKSTKMRVSKPVAIDNIQNISSRFRDEEEPEEFGEGWGE